jgi:hypothetical protein
MPRLHVAVPSCHVVVRFSPTATMLQDSMSGCQGRSVLVSSGPEDDLYGV